MKILLNLGKIGSKLHPVLTTTLTVIQVVSASKKLYDQFKK
jgi:hypothetical protein